MWRNGAIVAILVISMVGCASTQKQTSADQLQMRISDLERQMGGKDTEITELKDEVQNLSEEIKRKESMTAISSPIIESTARKEGIIRVDVSPQKIQLALQNAGFYSGPIDGKIGDKTKQAIAEFQKAHDLAQDGIIGKRTWAELKAYLN